MIMKKILILILSLIMTVSLVACTGQNNDGYQEKETISMSAQDIYSAVAGLYRTEIIDLEIAHTKYLGDLSSTTRTAVACKGFMTDSVEYYIREKVGISDFADEILVGGILYTNYGDEIKIKTSNAQYQSMEELEKLIREFPEISDFDKSEVTSDSEKATLTLTGISSGIFYEAVLGIKPQDFDSMTEYDEACAAYAFDASKYVLSITVNANGELVEITEDYSYDYSDGKATESYKVKTSTVLGNNVDKIKAPDDADEYYEY